MKKRLIRLGITFSVTFNAAVICGAVYATWFPKPASSMKTERLPIYERVDLAPEDKEVVRERYNETIRIIGEERNQLTQKWAEMAELIAQPELDRKAISAKEAEILELHRQAHEVVVKRWEGTREFLGPVKGERYFKTVRDWIQSHEGSRDRKASDKRD
ncbi:MAG TPA: periplasmic heavy metal sensor [Blastocatellia bacterium]|nr:periplasmic heavy metal sensor [Blastocatellia bacterium]